VSDPSSSHSSNPSLHPNVISSSESSVEQAKSDLKFNTENITQNQVVSLSKAIKGSVTSEGAHSAKKKQVKRLQEKKSYSEDKKHHSINPISKKVKKHSGYKTIF
jgi:hypothetical protein